jgi:hypothetical protein
MATKTLVPINGSRTASDQLALSFAASTTSFVAATDDVLVSSWEYIVFSLAYTNGDETSFEVKPQGFDGTTWQDCAFKATQASTVSLITPDALSLAKATFSTAYGAATLANIALPPISCLGFQRMRLMRKHTGGTPTGTLTHTATGGNTNKFGR